MILRGIHWAVSQAMKQAGYHWEVRRTGETRIGLWRKSWTSDARSSRSRRLVLIPGFGDTSMSWLTVLGLLRPAIRKRYDEVILIDFPGFAGFLSHERAFTSMDLLKDALFDILDSLRPQTILGHSLGGWLVNLYAVECGEGLRPKTQVAGPSANWTGPAHIILVDPSGVFVDERTARELQEKFSDAVAENGSGVEAIRNHVFAREPFWFPWVKNQLAHFFKSEEIARFVESFDSKHLISEERLSHVQARTWLIWGEKDSLIPPSAISVFLKVLNEKCPICRAIVLRNCGHSPQIEAPASLAVVLSQVLAEASGGKARYFGFPASQRFWRLIEES